MKHAIAVVVTLSFALIAWWIDLPKHLGAHPWWSQQVLISGALIGLLLGVVARWALRDRAIVPWLLLTGTAIGFAIAKYGQTQFAASYAEDAFAGQLWYFGWHATCALGFAFLTSLVLIAQRVFGK